MKKLINIPARHPKCVIAFIIALTVLAVGALIKPGIGMDPNPYALSPDHPSMVAYQELKQDYSGNLETVLILIRHPETIYNQATLTRVSRLTEALETANLLEAEDAGELAVFLPSLSGEVRDLLASILEDGITAEDDFALMELLELVAGGEEIPAGQPDAVPAGLVEALEDVMLRLQPVKKVTSIANVENIIARNDDLRVGKIFDAVPATGAELEQVAGEVRSNELFRKMLISEDEKSTGILVETYIPVEKSNVMLALADKTKVLLEEIPGEEEVHISGIPVMAAMATDLMQKDNATLFPVVVGLVVAVLFLIFRSLSGVLLPLGVVIISLLWTLGIMAILGVPLNMITSTLPVFLITIGVADGIHLMSEFKDNFRRMGNRNEAVLATMRHMALPVIMTSVTTAAGFIALSFTDIQKIKEFGTYIAVGAMMAMIVSLTLIPAVLALGKNRSPAQAESEKAGKKDVFGDLILGALLKVSRISLYRPGLVLTVGLVVVGIGVYGMTRVKVENDFITYFEKSNPIVQATKALDENLAGSNVANILVTAPEGAEGYFKNPENLALVAGLQNHISQQPFVGKTISLIDIVKRINLVMNNNDPAYNRLPQTLEWVTIPGAADGGQPRREQVSGRNQIAQYLLLYENGGGENLTDFTDSQYNNLNLRVFLSTRSSTEISKLATSIEDYVASNFPPEIKVRFAGLAELNMTTNNEVVNGQISSLVISLVVILILLLIEFRSLSKGLLGMVPLTFAVIFNFGVLGIFGIDLNMATAIISSIVIGIGVDFAIHYLTRLEIELGIQKNLEKAIEATMATCGKAITSNAVIVAIGFLALLMAGMVPMRNVGLMISQLLLVSAISTLFLIPSLIVLFRPAFARFPEPETADEAQDTLPKPAIGVQSVLSEQEG